MNKTNNIIKHNLVIWVCWIWKGHTFRQLPIIEHYKNLSNIVIFSFWESYNYFSKKYSNDINIKVIEVSVPWIVWSLDWINFLETANKSENNQNFINKNFIAMDSAIDFLWYIDLVISDYEPVSAQLSYMKWVKFITIDQQSKYFLISQWFNDINWLSYKEEISRLNLFFPYVGLRIATSFFNLENNWYHFWKKVKLISPIIKKDIVNLKKNTKENKILIYISSYSNFVQSSSDVFEVLTKFSSIDFSIYAPANSDFILDINNYFNIRVYKHWDNSFLDNLSQSSWVISTAWHTFISEMMYLQIPMYLVPLWTYEQEYNAKIINDNNFWLSSKSIKYNTLKTFIENIDDYRLNIKNDKKVLLKWVWQKKIITIIDKYLLSKS